MCYMSGRSRPHKTRVGVRELRQNLSVYLERVAEGTTFHVTDRGRAVALLIPLPPAATTTERLIASGRAAPAERDLLSLGKPTGRARTSVSHALREVRDDLV
jgi:prevent-host-death family protein